MAKIISNSKAKNYIMEDNSIYILDDFELNSMNELIGNLSAMIRELPVVPIYESKSTIISPYNTTDKNPIIDIFIDSNGGSTRVLRDISTLLNYAKARGAIIRTTVLSCAYSCGSLLAIQGTPGFRIMAHDAEHMIHFGSSSIYAESQQMMEHLMERSLNNKKIVNKKYETYTKLPKDKIEELTTTEGRFLTAEECLKYNLCDWILGENGQLTGRDSR